MKKFLASFLATLVLTLLSINFVAASTAKADVEKSDFKISQTADFLAAVADFGIIRASDQFEVRSNYFTAVNRNVAVETRNIFQKVQLINSGDFSFKFSPPRFKRITFNPVIANEQRLDKSKTISRKYGGVNFVPRE